jgi:hypothetical protein
MKHILPKRLLIEWYRRARSRRDIARLVNVPSATSA